MIKLKLCEWSDDPEMDALKYYSQLERDAEKHHAEIMDSRRTDIDDLYDYIVDFVDNINDVIDSYLHESYKYVILDYEYDYGEEECKNRYTEEIRDCYYDDSCETGDSCISFTVIGNDGFDLKYEYFCRMDLYGDITISDKLCNDIVKYLKDEYNVDADIKEFKSLR